MSGKKKTRKAVESLEKRIKEHRQKQEKTTSKELFYYWEKEIEKFAKEKKKKEKWL